MYRLAYPSTQLKRFIETYWFVTSSPDEEFQLEVDVYVDAQADMVVNFGSPYSRLSKMGDEEEIAFSSIDAQRSLPVTIRQSGNVQLCGVRFRRGGLAAFTDKSMRELTDLVVPIAQVFGPEADAFRNRLVEEHGKDDASTELLDRFFAERLIPRSSYLRFLDLRDHLEAVAPDIPTVDGLADLAGLSRRSIERLFSKYVGITPKLYLRIERFQFALRRMMDDPFCDLGEITHAAGYYDQPHLVKEFHALAGGVPRQYRGYLPDEGIDFAPNVVRYSDPLAHSESEGRPE